MSSNFFEQQDKARKKTTLLVGLFIAAVIGVTISLYVVVLIALTFSQSDTTAANGQAVAQPVPYVGAFIGTLLGVLVVVGGCSLYKVSSLRRGGGESVAMTLGGRLLSPGTTEFHERKILNVVEEMALASGTPVPPVYLMEHESGINAFAAGYAPESAVIGITRGAIEQLSRDELQGVVAHEFSHILNGDMRINIRLMGVIFGLIAIAVIGRVALRAAWFTGGGRGKKDARIAIAITLAGVALLIIGGIGVLFGRLIQAAVSRQREFLADASAVQFTRNPDTIGGALKRIGGFGSQIEDGHASEVSHMFIASAASSWGFGPFATHPPIEKRIREIDPSWDGTYMTKKRAIDTEPTAKKASAADKLSPIPMLGGESEVMGGLPGAIIGAAVLGEAAGASQPPTPSKGAPAQNESALDMVGSISANHVAYMHELLGRIPGAFKEAAHDPQGSQAVVYAVLLDSDTAVQTKQLKYLQTHAEQGVVGLTQKLAEQTGGLDKEARLPLLDMAVPALREMSDTQYEAFKKNVHEMVKADGRVDLFEWALERMLVRHLDPHFNPAPDPKVRYYSLKPVLMPCGMLLSVLAYVGQKDPAGVAKAFSAGVEGLDLAGVSLLDKSAVKLGEVGKALDELVHISLREKKKLIAACARTIAADGEVTRSEGELMRAIADSLGVPMPPLLPGQKLV